MTRDFVVVAGQYLYLAVIALLFLAWIRAPRGTKLRFLLAVAVAGAVAYSLSLIAGHLYYEARPFVARHVAPLIPHAADNGFPSDHALLTMTITAVTFFFSRKIAALMLVATILVGVARVMALVHSPVDIAGAWTLGVVGAVVAYYMVRALWLWIVKPGPGLAKGHPKRLLNNDASPPERDGYA